MVACNENLTSPGYAQIRLICAGFTEVLGDTGPRIVGDRERPQRRRRRECRAPSPGGKSAAGWAVTASPLIARCSLALALGQEHVTSRRTSAAERVAGRYRAPGEQSTQPLRRRCHALAGSKPAGTTDSQIQHLLRNSLTPLGCPMWSEFRRPGSSTPVVRVLGLVVHGVPPAEVAGVASVLPWR
jgi:hypothetical protein